MIGILSGYVPWWGAVLIAVIAAVGGPVAVLLQSRHQDKVRLSELRHDAYLRLIEASEIVAFRSTVVGGQRSAGNAIASSFSDLRKAMIVLLLGTVFDRPLRKRPGILSMFISSIPTPTPLQDSIDLNSLHMAFEELIKANIGVNLYGSVGAINAAEKLLDDSKNFYKLIQSGNWTWRGLPAADKVTEFRNKMTESTSAFVAVARSELELKEPKA
jgi:hypothetical protein